MPRRGLRQLGEIGLLDAERLGIAGNRRDLFAIEHAVHQGHDRQQLQRIGGELAVGERLGQLCRRHRREVLELERCLLPKHVAADCRDAGLVGFGDLVPSPA